MTQAGSAAIKAGFLTIYLHELIKDSGDVDAQEINLVACALLSLTKVQVMALRRGTANAIILQWHLFLASKKLEAKAEHDLLFDAISFNSLFGEDW